MIKLTRKEDKALSVFNGIEYAFVKTDLINWLFIGNGLLAETFNTDELKLKAIQAILDGEWEVEEPLYYVKFIDSENGYLNIRPDGSQTILNKMGSYSFKTTFTRQEAIAIDTRYLEFLEEVE